MNPNCNICGNYEKDSPFLCSKCKHVAGKFHDLESNLHKAESHSYWIKEKLRMLLRETSQQIESGAENISVPRQLLQDLIDVAAPRGNYNGARDKFWSDTILVGMIAIDAADMLRARGTKMFPRVFGMLKKHVEQYYKLHNWKNESLEPGTRICRNIWDAEPIE